VVPGAGETVVYVRLKPGAEAKTQVFDDGEAKRLIVDVARASPTGKASTPKAPVPVPKPAAKKPPVVVIDPGHGGIDPGAVGYVIEKAITLDVGLRLKRLLEAEGIQVVMTRSRDMHLSTDKRTDLGMRAAMTDSSKRNLFVSIHVNSAVRPAQGIEVYYFGETMSPSLLAQVIRENGGGNLGQQLTREARGVAQQAARDVVAQANLQFSRRLAQMVHDSIVGVTGAVDRGVQSAPFYVIRNARIPAILTEIGFANHPQEGPRLADPNYREKLAQAMAQAITKFLANGAFAQR
jgi:N-acetylmuramoyl-L-alanine amidase